jgi:DNA-binding transcriptional MerR regulator
MSELWTIEQLTALVEKALQAARYDGQQSRRVRDVPDLRTIRYYTTLGLLDPPAELRGRKAYYGRRHLMQLVAIKRLQARGMALVQVQESLLGANDRSLARWAALPADFWQDIPAAMPTERPISADALLAESDWPETKNGLDSRVADRRAFWAAVPEISEAVRPPKSELKPRGAIHLPVGDGVELVIEGVDPSHLTPEAIARVAPSLEGLIRTLQDLQLTPAPSSAGSEPGPRTSSRSQLRK